MLPVIRIKSLQDKSDDDVENNHETIIEFTVVYLKLPYGQNEWIYRHVVYETSEAVMDILQQNWLEFGKDLFLIGSSDMNLQEIEVSRSEEAILDTIVIEFNESGDLIDTGKRENDSQKIFDIEITDQYSGCLKMKQHDCYLAVREENGKFNLNIANKHDLNECTFQFSNYVGFYYRDADKSLRDYKKFSLMKHLHSNKFVMVTDKGTVILGPDMKLLDKLRYVMDADSRFFVQMNLGLDNLLQPVHLEGSLLAVDESFQLYCHQQFDFDLVDMTNDDLRKLFTNSTKPFLWQFLE